MRLSKQMANIIDDYMTPVQAAEVASEAGVKQVVFVHVVLSVLNLVAKRMFMKGVGDVFDGDIALGEDGMVFELEPKP